MLYPCILSDACGLHLLIPTGCKRKACFILSKESFFSASWLCKYGNNTANRELKLKYQALCAWELVLPRFTSPDFADLSGKTFRAPKPWYYQQVLDGTLK